MSELIPSTVSLRFSPPESLLALIGGDWLKVQADGRRRIDEPNDFVRFEIKAALDLGIRVVPVLLGQTMMAREMAALLQAMWSVRGIESTMPAFEEDAD